MRLRPKVPSSGKVIKSLRAVSGPTPFDLAELLDLGLELFRSAEQLLHEPINLVDLLSQLRHRALDLALKKVVPGLAEPVLLSRSAANKTVATLQ